MELSALSDVDSESLTAIVANSVSFTEDGTVVSDSSTRASLSASAS